MASNSGGNLRKLPVCGSLSMLVPVVGMVVDWVALQTISDPWGFGLLAVLIGITMLFTFAGAAFGLAAFTRGEKYLLLPVIGLLVNAAPYVWFFCHLK